MGGADGILDRREVSLRVGLCREAFGARPLSRVREWHATHVGTGGRTRPRLGICAAATGSSRPDSAGNLNCQCRPRTGTMVSWGPIVGGGGLQGNSPTLVHGIPAVSLRLSCDGPSLPGFWLAADYGNVPIARGSADQGERT